MSSPEGLSESLELGNVEKALKIVDDRVGGRACHNQICPKGRERVRNGLDLFYRCHKATARAAFIDLLRGFIY